MIKNLTKHGNSWALVIDKPILELLKIEPDTKLEISTDGLTLLITPISQATRKERLSAARQRLNKQHANAFKKLAE